MSRSMFHAIWPVVDPTQPLAQLYHDAEMDLPAVAKRHGVRVVGPTRWRVEDAAAVPGSGGHTRHVIVARTWVERRAKAAA